MTTTAHSSAEWMRSRRREDEFDLVRTLEKQIAPVDAVINQRVHALYGLTEDEIKVVEGKYAVIELDASITCPHLKITLQHVAREDK